MDTIKLGYSTKNIPICDRRQYIVKIFDMTSRFIDRIRWKVYWYENNDQKDATYENPDQQNFGFPTRNAAPADKRLESFETDMYNMIKNIKFRNNCNEFIRKLNNDVKEIKNSSMVYVFADKSNNIYKMEPSKYAKLLNENITAEYKKIPNSTVDTINKETEELIQVTKIKGKIPKLEENQAFLTVKDHKKDFPRNIKCRLINPSKNHIAKASKIILDQINVSIRKETGLLQWRKTKDVLDWFNGIEN